MIDKESDKKKIAVLKDSINQINNEMLRLTNIREDIHAINREKWAEKIRAIKEDLGAQQMLLFIGPYSSGKSSFVNAILGEDILPTASRPCTSVCTELRFKNDGTGHVGRAIKKDGSATEVDYDFNNLIKMIDGPTGAIGQSAAYHHIELEYDIAQLETENANLSMLCAAGITIVDCPGYESPYACNEDIIDEYISKATHTFWMNPVNKFGGSAEVNKIKNIRQKTTTLIPVFTKADLKPDEEDRDELREKYVETIGGLFRHKEPIFTSAIKWKEGIELSKKSDSSNTEKIDKLIIESGIHKVLGAIVDVTGNKEVTDAKVNSCRLKIDDIIKELTSSTEREQNYWKSELNILGWDEGRNEILNDIKYEAEVWIKNEADRVGKRLNSDLTDEVVSYICETGEKVKVDELQKKVISVWKDVIENNEKQWSAELVKIYREKVSKFTFDSDKSFDVPDWLNGETFQNQIKGYLSDAMTAISRGGLVSSIEGVAGVTLFALAGEVAAAKFFGHAVLAGIMGPVGGVLVGVAAISIVPHFIRAVNDRKEQNRKEVTRKVESWLEQLDTSRMIAELLMNMNDTTFNRLSEDFDKEAADKKKSYNTCLEISRSLNSIHANILQQFSSIVK